MTPGLGTRLALPDDYAPIAAVVDEWWGRPIVHALPRLFLDHFHRTSLVAEDDEGLAGFLFHQSMGFTVLHPAPDSSTAEDNYVRFSRDLG